MYKCRNCDSMFEETTTVYESHPYGMGYALEPWSACPYCKDTDIVKLKQCENCEEWFEKEELDDDLCPECWREEYGEE